VATMSHFDWSRLADYRVLIAIAIILVATWVASRVIQLFLRRYRGHVFPAALKSASLIATLARIALWAVAIMLILEQVGISIAPLLTALGVGGLAVALALQPTLGNLFSGLQLLASRQINPNDYVKFDGGEGRIMDITWRNAIIEDHIGATIVVPNQQLAQATVVSYSVDRPPEAVVAYPISFSVPRALDLRVLEERLAERAKKAGAREAQLRLLSISGESVQCVLGATLDRNGDPFAVRDEVLREVCALFGEREK
jgi:small-conductance mechanosensitive channel